MLPSRRAETSPAERSTARCWLMFGTWQLTRDGQLAHGGLAVGEGLEDAQALGVAEGPRDRREAVAILLGAIQDVDHGPKSVTVCARTQVSREARVAAPGPMRTGRPALSAGPR